MKRAPRIQLSRRPARYVKFFFNQGYDNICCINSIQHFLEKEKHLKLLNIALNNSYLIPKDWIISIILDTLFITTLEEGIDL